MKGVIKLQPRMLLPLAQENENVFVEGNFFFVNRAKSAIPMLVNGKMDVPLFVETGRFVRIISGAAKFLVNMQPVDLRAGDILIIPRNTYMEMCEMSPDYDAQVVSFNELLIPFPRYAHLRLGAGDFERTGKYLELIWQLVHEPSFSMQTVSFLMSALISDLQRMHKLAEQGKPAMSRGEQQMQQFLDLVTEYGCSQRNIKFYAEKMLLSPNHLSSVVRKQSSKSVMQWFNARTILQAKILLRHTDLSISDIANQLSFHDASGFSRFFLRETGLRPLEYKGLL